MQKDDRDSDFDATRLKTPTRVSSKNSSEDNDLNWQLILTDTLKGNFKKQQLLLYALIGLVCLSMMWNGATQSSSSDDWIAEKNSLKAKLANAEKRLEDISSTPRKSNTEMRLIEVACNNMYFEDPNLITYCKKLD